MSVSTLAAQAFPRAPGADTSGNPPTWPVVLAGFCAFLSLYATQPILPLLSRLFHAGKAEVSLTVLASTLGVAISAPFMGRLADRAGRRRVIVLSALALGIISLLAATSTTLGLLVFWRFLQGVFTPGVFAVTVTYINEEWDRTRMGSAMAAYVSGTVVGGFFGRLCSGIVADHIHWRAVFLVLGLLDLAMTAAIWRWLPRERKAKRGEPGAMRSAALRHLRNGALLARYGVGFCVLFSLVSMFTYATFYLAAPPFNLPPAILGLIFVVYLVGAAATPVAGLWLDRVGSRRMLIFAASLAMAGGVATLEPNLWTVTAGLAICGTGIFIAQAAISSSLGVCTPTHKALAVGLYVSCYYLGGSVGSTLPAWAWRVGGWPACVALVAAAQTAILVIALFFWQTPASGKEPVADALAPI
jgi:MFS transporter, YNFM family, putative membrane transport protein